MIYDQAEFEIRCEWGENGVAQLAPISDVVIVVDVLSFCTCVDIVTGRGAAVYPCREQGETAVTFAKSVDGILANHKRATSGYTLSPRSLLDIPKDTRLVLSSPNGAILSLGTGDTVTLAGCLRNAAAVANAAVGYGRSIAVIPAGERWWASDRSLRPAFEDLLGAGAIIHYLRRHLPDRLAPEAQAALACFSAYRETMTEGLQTCSSGKELIVAGFNEDVELAAAFNDSAAVPLLVDGAYVNDPRSS